VQAQSNPALFNALVEALPLAFLESLAVALRRVNAEAQSTAETSPLLEEPEVAYLMPHLRRAFFEKQFRDSARKAGLKPSVSTTRGDTAQFSVVNADGFVFTASYIGEPGGIPRSAAFRNEMSNLNDLLEQATLFPEEEPARAPSREVDPIYCIVAYGGGVRGVQPWMQFVFPAPTAGGSIDRYKFDDVLVAKRGLTTPRVEKDIDTAFPTPKKKRSTGTDDDSSTIGS